MAFPSKTYQVAVSVPEGKETASFFFSGFFRVERPIFLHFTTAFFFLCIPQNFLQKNMQKELTDVLFGVILYYTKALTY